MYIRTQRALAVGVSEIKEKRYEEELISKGISVEKIKKYAFAFCGKRVLIKEM